MSSVKIPVSPVSSLTPLSSALEKLIYFFCYGWDFIIKPKDQTWTTVSRYLLLPRTFERYWHNPKLLLGLRFGNLTRLGCIDLDKHSKYHPWINPQAYRRIIKALKKLGICRTVLIQSSDSGGVHLFFFFFEQINTFNLACGLTKVLIEDKFELGLGQLEIFPNTKRWVDPKKGFSLYNGLRVPLQPGTGAKILDPNTFEPIPGGINEFVEQMIESSTKQNLKLLNQELATARDWYKEYKKSLGWNYEEQWERDLEVRLSGGFTGSGQTNDILRDLANLGRVFRGKNTEEKLTEFIEEEVIALPGYRKHCGHQQEIAKRSHDWGKSAIDYWAQWKNKPEQRTKNFKQLHQEMRELSGKEPEVDRKIFRGRWCRTNQKRHDETLDKLQEILKNYPVRLMPKAVLKRKQFLKDRCKVMFGTKFSDRTLNKAEYRKLWHPKFTHDQAGKAGVNNPLWVRFARYIACKTLETLALCIEKIEKKATQKLQDEKQSNKSFHKKITPSKCSIVKATKNNEAKNLLLLESQQKDHTLMKCFVDPFSEEVYRTPDEKQDLIKKYKLRRNNKYFYSGVSTSNITGVVDQRKKVNWLNPGDQVKITNEVHSSSLSGGMNQILVYAKKLDGIDKNHYLVRLDDLLSITKNNHYVTAILPQIKELVLSLNCTKEDYLQYLKQVYNVMNTAQLFNEEVFNVLNYLRYLYLKQNHKLS